MLLISAWEFPTKQTFTQRGWFPLCCRLGASECYQNRHNHIRVPKTSVSCRPCTRCARSKRSSFSECATSLDRSPGVAFNRTPTGELSWDSSPHMALWVSSRQTHLTRRQTPSRAEQRRRDVNVTFCGSYQEFISPEEVPSHSLSVEVFSTALPNLNTKNLGVLSHPENIFMNFCPS